MKAHERAFRILIRSPRDVLRRIAGAPRIVRGQTLDVQLHVMLDAMKRLHITQPDDVEGSRREMDASAEIVGRAPIAMATERDVLVPGPSGAMRARVYRPKTATATSGMLVYFHGGGFVSGSIASHDASVRALAHESGVVIASIDYALGPEYMFPAAPNDAIAAYSWARAHAADFGVSPSRGSAEGGTAQTRARVGVGGDSAGGNLAAVTCHLAREKKIEQPSHQLLIYPAIDWSRACESHRTFGVGTMLDEARTFWFEERYLNRIEERDDPRASPIRYTDFSGLAPATIVTAGFDILCDEGRVYAEALARGGTRVDFCCEESLVHGFFNMSGAIDGARAANSWIAMRLREALG